jgi:signal peptidase I
MFPSRIAQTLTILLSSLSSSRYQVGGSSMSPTLVSGQHVLAGPLRVPRDKLGRCDIVVMRHPVERHRIYIKRIIGLPEENIRLQGGLVYVNDSLLEETYLNGRPQQRNKYDREWWLGPNEYFVMGDNRSDSQDSRAFGPVHRDLIVGRVWFRYWPLRAWGKVSGSPGPVAYDREGLA